MKAVLLPRAVHWRAFHQRPHLVKTLQIPAAERENQTVHLPVAEGDNGCSHVQVSTQNQTEAQRSGFGLERRSDGMNER